MGVQAVLQALRQAEILKQRIIKSSPKEFLLPRTIALQKELQHLYRHILLIDMNYGLDNKIEQDLWNVGFKLGISSLQELIRNKQCNISQKSEYSAMLCWYISGASGFFLTLLNAIWGDKKDVADTRVELSYLAQYCLVHLGDLARYQGHKEQAQNYYEHSIKLAPMFGHAYNQLALLEPKTSSMDALKICTLYCRAAGAPQSFAPAHNNLMRLLEEYKTFEFNELTCTDVYISAFMKQIYYVLSNSIYDMNIEYPKLLAVSEEMCVEMFILLIYSYDHIIDSPFKESELSKDEQISKRIILKLFVHLFIILDFNGSPYKSSYLILSWIMRNEHLMKESTFMKAIEEIQNYFQTLTKNLSVSGHNTNNEGILQEEFDLMTYLPFGLSGDSNIVSDNLQDVIRCSRLIKWTKQFLDTITNITDFYPKDFDEITVNDTKPDLISVITRSVPNETPKLKLKTRTNVAMQTILQMHKNIMDTNIPSCSLPTMETHAFENSFNDCDKLTLEENESSQNAIRSLYSLPIDSPPLPPVDWLDDNSKTAEGNEIQNNSLFADINMSNDNICYNPVIMGMDNETSAWNHGASYSLFSGHSPLAKLLEDQRNKSDKSVIK